VDSERPAVLGGVAGGWRGLRVGAGPRDWRRGAAGSPDPDKCKARHSVGSPDPD
jgi:hypothetical protein